MEISSTAISELSLTPLIPTKANWNKWKNFCRKWSERKTWHEITDEMLFFQENEKFSNEGTQVNNQLM